MKPRITKMTSAIINVCDKGYTNHTVYTQDNGLLTMIGPIIQELFIKDLQIEQASTFVTELVLDNRKRFMYCDVIMGFTCKQIKSDLIYFIFNDEKKVVIYDKENGYVKPVTYNLDELTEAIHKDRLSVYMQMIGARVGDVY